MKYSRLGSEPAISESAADHTEHVRSDTSVQPENAQISASCPWLQRLGIEIRNQFNLRNNLRALYSIPPFHEPVIDGVRAIAICWVISVHLVLYHLGIFRQQTIRLFQVPWLHFVARGDLGVDLFFVISGYLIGSLLLSEVVATRTLNLRRFYLRRFLRLIPVYVAAMVIALYLLHGLNAARIWANLVYVNNFFPIQKQFMPWCWSLAIEEQFYLLLPVCVLLLMKLKQGRWLCMCAFFVLAGVIRWSIIRNHGILPPFTDMPGMRSYDWRLTIEYQNLYSRYGALLVGVMGAYASIFHKKAVDRFFSRNLTVNAIGIVCLFTMVVIGFTSVGLPASTPSATEAYFFDGIFNRFSPSMRQLWYTEHRDVLALCTLFLILAGITSTSWLGLGIRKLLSWRIFRPIAQLSYSLYLTHEMILYRLFPKTSAHLLKYFDPYITIAADCAIALIVAFVCSAVLFILIEKPSMDMRSLPSIRELA